MVKVINRNTRQRHEVCSKLKIKTPEGRNWRRSAVFINFVFLVSSLLSLPYFESSILSGLRWFVGYVDRVGSWLA